MLRGTFLNLEHNIQIRFEHQSVFINYNAECIEMEIFRYYDASIFEIRPKNVSSHPIEGVIFPFRGMISFTGLLGHDKLVDIDLFPVQEE